MFKSAKYNHGNVIEDHCNIHATLLTDEPVKFMLLY